MVVIADQRLIDPIVIEKDARVPRILARDQVALLQNPHRAKRDVFEVADRRGHQVQNAGHVPLEYNVRVSKFTLLLLSSALLFGQGPTLLVLQKGQSSLAYYGPTGQQLATVPVGPHPHEMVLSADGRYLYCTDNGTMLLEQPGEGNNTVSIVDVAARKKVGEISLGNYRRPHGIDLDRATGKLYVTTELPDQLLAIDTATRKILRTYDTKGKTSHIVKLGRGAKVAYVSNSSSSNIAAIDLASGAVTLIPTGVHPEGSVVSSDGTRLYTANREGASITIIDTAKNAAIGEIKSGKGTNRITITPDGSFLIYSGDAGTPSGDRRPRLPQSGRPDRSRRRAGVAEPVARRQARLRVGPG